MQNKNHTKLDKLLHEDDSPPEIQLETKVEKLLEKLMFLLSICFVAFHLYTAWFGVVSGLGQKAIHIGFILILFYMQEYLKHQGQPVKRGIDALFFGISLASITYFISISISLYYRSGIVYTVDIIFGLLLIAAIMEATRRKIDIALFIVVACFIVYGFAARFMPGVLKYTGMTIQRFINIICLSSDGIWGSALYASAAYIMLFIFLGAIFQATGVGQFFTDLAMLGLGKYSGGPAKVSVVASGFFGSISGSTIANVVGTGTFTIPMMKDTGFDAEFAGGVEASASTGGQIMPPVMGATAFLIAESVNISYFQLIKAAAIPAILFYAAILITVHFYAKKHHIRGVPPEQLPDKKVVLRQIYLVSPLLFILVALGPLKMTVARTGVYSILLTLVLCQISPRTRINRERAENIIKNCVSGAMSVAIACAVVGIITGVIMCTGLGIRLSNVLITLAGHNVALLLVLTMVASLIMGMGVPTTAAYITLSVLVAPALVEMEVSRIAAHLFIFYFGIISSVTPPVALAAYAAAGIAKCNPARCGYKAFKLSISGFIIPFMFIYSPTLLCQGEWYLILWGLLTALIGIYCLSGVVEQYFIRWNVSKVEVLLLAIAALSLISGSVVTDVAGLLIVTGMASVRCINDRVTRSNVDDVT